MNLSEAMVSFPPLHVIYHDPTDYPGSVVVRAWYGPMPGPTAIVLRSVDDARQFVHDYTDACVCVPRARGDAVSIVESWL